MNKLISTSVCNQTIASALFMLCSILVVSLKLLNGNSFAAVNESVGEVQFEIEAVAGMFLQYSLTVMVETSPGSADGELV